MIKKAHFTSIIVLGALGCAPTAAPECPAPPSAPAQQEQPASPAPPTPAVAAATSAPAPSKPIATTPAEVNMHPEYARSLARAAYIWAYPMVNTWNRRATIGKAPQPGFLNGVLPVAPVGQLSMLTDYIDPGQRFVACPNQDVVYGLGFFELDTQPVIIQVPDFGDRFWVYAIYDARTDQVGHLGKPYGTKPGFYALVGPNYKGEVPKGMAGVIVSTTSFANVVPRVFMNDTAEDRAAIQPLVNQIMAYPFSDHTGSMKTMVWKNAPSIPGPSGAGGGETKWVKPDVFFDELPAILASVPPLPGEEALYEQLQTLLDVAKRDPKIKAILVDTAKELDKSFVQESKQWKYNGVPAGNGWTRSKNNAAWGRDYYNRVTTSRSNIFENRPSETQYYYTDFDSNEKQLSGGGNYEVTFAKGELPPVNGFWSLTLYDEEHFFSPNKVNRYSLGTKNTTLKYNADGSLTLYAGNKSPGADKESNWLPAPAGKFSLYIRAYWGKEGVTDGTWKPPLVVKK